MRSQPACGKITTMEKITHKATLRIPTKQQYAYIEVTLEGTPDEIVLAYLKLTETYWKNQKQWDKDAPPF